MPSQKNISAVAELTNQLTNAKSVVIANYSGLDVGAQNDLRAKLTEVGGNLKVTKNRLFKIAVKNHLDSLPDDLEEVLQGQNAFLFSTDDAVSALKVIFEFAEDNEALEIKLGLLDGKILSYDETKDLSKLPSKPELVAQLIARIQGPVYGLVNVVQGPTRSLVYVLSAIKDKKE